MTARTVPVTTSSTATIRPKVAKLLVGVPRVAPGTLGDLAPAAASLSVRTGMAAASGRRPAWLVSVTVARTRSLVAWPELATVPVTEIWPRPPAGRLPWQLRVFGAQVQELRLPVPASRVTLRPAGRRIDTEALKAVIALAALDTVTAAAKARRGPAFAVGTATDSDRSLKPKIHLSAA